jgi:hypothetical protein
MPIGDETPREWTAAGLRRRRSGAWLRFRPRRPANGGDEREANLSPNNNVNLGLRLDPVSN